MDRLIAAPSRMAKELESQFNNATSDAGFLAAAARIVEPRSFEEMFEILESLIEEAEETNEEVLRTLLEINTHIPANIRNLLVKEAWESGESVLYHLHKFHGWLRESELEAVEENLNTDCYHERQCDKDGSLLPRPEDYGNKEPQGCEHNETMPSTKDSAQLASVTDDLTSWLGAESK